MTNEDAERHLSEISQDIEGAEDEAIPGTYGLTWKAVRRCWAETINEVKNHCINNQEGLITLPGHPMNSEKAYILWVVILEERRFGWLEEFAIAISNGRMTARTEANESPGIRIQFRE